MSKASQKPDLGKKHNSKKEKSKVKEYAHKDDMLNLDGVAHVANSRNLLSRLKSWSRSQLLAPFTVGAGCCARELMRLEGPNPQSYTIREKFNQERIDSCDVIIISGVINPKLTPYLLRVYEKMMPPKYCIAVGTCAATGAIFNTTPVKEIIPVDIYIPGCPPSVDALVHGIELLRENIKMGASRHSHFHDDVSDGVNA